MNHLKNAVSRVLHSAGLGTFPQTLRKHSAVIVPPRELTATLAPIIADYLKKRTPEGSNDEELDSSSTHTVADSLLTISNWNDVAQEYAFHYCLPSDGLYNTPAHHELWALLHSKTVQLSKGHFYSKCPNGFLRCNWFARHWKINDTAHFCSHRAIRLAERYSPVHQLFTPPDYLKQYICDYRGCLGEI